MQGVVLTPPDIRDVLNVLVAFDTVSIWIGRLGSEFTGLHGLNGRVPQLPFLRGKLDEIVDGQGEIKDTASARLLSIRKSLREFQERLRKRAEEMTRQKAFSDYLQEPIVTIRNGRYVLPVKQEYASRVQGIVLSLIHIWAQNQSVALFPVTPHMLKWLRLSEEGSSVAMLPIPGPNGQSGFYFTVPGYAVMATDETEFTCAFELGKILARTRGRWAARAIGGIPCFIQDVPVYHLESGFSREERLDLIAEFEKSGSRILRLDEFLMRGEIRPGITSLIERYLSGKLNKEQLEEGIRSRMRGYTNH